MSDSFPRCIECGGTVDSLNEDDDGVPCPACAERWLETAPGVFHTPWNEDGTSMPDTASSGEGHDQDSHGESWLRADSPGRAVP